MQASQAKDFPQFTSTMIRWVEDSCRPAVKILFSAKEETTRVFSSRISTKSFAEWSTVSNRNREESLFVSVEKSFPVFFFFCIFFVFMKFFTRLNLDLSRVFFPLSSYQQMSAKIRRYNFIKVLGEGQVNGELHEEKKIIVDAPSTLWCTKRRTRERTKMWRWRRLRSAVDRKHPMGSISLLWGKSNFSRNWNIPISLK